MVDASESKHVCPTAFRVAKAGRPLLVIAEVALSVILVVLSGELLGAFSRLVATDPGFDADHVVASVILLWS